MPKRRKMEAVDAPKTLPEAIETIERYVAVEIEIEQLEATRDAAIVKIKGETDKLKKPLEQELKRIVGRLGAWWAVAGDALTGGKKRSTELAGCMIGLRLTTARLVNKDARSDAAMLSVLQLDDGLKPFIRLTPSVDKEAIARAIVTGALVLGKEEADRTEEEKKALGTARSLSKLGFGLSQSDQFFIDRPKPPAVETIAEPQQEAA